MNGTDYTKDNITGGVQYQLQGIHRTLVHHYNDTLDFLVISTKYSDVTIVRVSPCERTLSYGGLFYTALTSSLFFLMT